MKRFIITAILILPVLFSCTDKSEDGAAVATSVVLSQDKVDLQVGETATITATVHPTSLEMDVVWSVLEPEYASVDKGTITGLKEGVTYVVAVSADGNQRAACMVSVNPEVKYSVTIKDSKGQALDAIYGYPGMSINLAASTSDGETHRLTWSVEDSSVGTISADGILKLSPIASADAAFVYDAQSFVKVVTEDGCGSKIPVRSSLLKGIKVDDTYEPAGTIITIQESESHSVAAMYQGEDAPEAIPADGINLELSNTSAFSLVRTGASYSLLTGSASAVTTKLFASVVGKSDKVEIAEFKIDKSYPIKAQLVGTSSSTLSFTWTEGGSTDDDIAKPYTIALYKDEACTDLEVSYNIPADEGCWKGNQPRFVLSGLLPGTDYWFKVTDTTSGDEKESAIIPATTDEFNCVMIPDDPASEGDIILAEDFGQLCWGADEISMSAGFDVADQSVAYNADTQKSFMCRDAAMFVGITSQYAQRSLTAQTVAKKEAGLRIAHWAQGQYARIYVGPGYMFLSTTSYGTHIVTPKLTCIPENMTATLKITLHASGKVSGKQAVLAVQHDKSFYEISAGNQTNKNTLDLSTNVETITFSGGITNLEEFEVTIGGVVSGDRIAFGPTSETLKDNSNMMIISDMTVQIIELE